MTSLACGAHIQSARRTRTCTCSCSCSCQWLRAAARSDNAPRTHPRTHARARTHAQVGADVTSGEVTEKLPLRKEWSHCHCLPAPHPRDLRLGWMPAKRRQASPSVPKRRQASPSVAKRWTVVSPAFNYHGWRYRRVTSSPGKLGVAWRSAAWRGVARAAPPAKKQDCYFSGALRVGAEHIAGHKVQTQAGRAEQGRAGQGRAQFSSVRLGLAGLGAAQPLPLSLLCPALTCPAQGMSSHTRDCDVRGHVRDLH